MDVKVFVFIQTVEVAGLFVQFFHAGNGYGGDFFKAFTDILYVYKVLNTVFSCFSNV